MNGWHEEDDFEAVRAAIEAEEEYERSPKGIAESNRHLVRQQAVFRRAADLVAAALAEFDEVTAIALFGSVARPLWKEVPRFRTYRRARIELWHECHDVDIALWLSRLDRLHELRRGAGRALHGVLEETGRGVAPHQLDIFVLQPGTDRYLGRLCGFKKCPAGKRDCLAPGCGATAFLKQHAGFRLHGDALAPGHAVTLFDRAAGTTRRAVDLPGPGAAEPR